MGLKIVSVVHLFHLALILLEGTKNTFKLCNDVLRKTRKTALLYEVSIPMFYVLFNPVNGSEGI